MLFEGENTGQVCLPRTNDLSEMARVANVERGNFVCEYHCHILRTTNNVPPYPLPRHLRAMNLFLIPEKLFQVFNEMVKRMPYKSIYYLICLSIDPERGGALV